MKKLLFTFGALIFLLQAISTTTEAAMIDLSDFDTVDSPITFFGENNSLEITTAGIPNPVPEPATCALLGMGLLLLAGFRRKKSKPQRCMKI